MLFWLALLFAFIAISRHYGWFRWQTKEERDAALDKKIQQQTEREQKIQKGFDDGKA